MDEIWKVAISTANAITTILLFSYGGLMLRNLGYIDASATSYLGKSNFALMVPCLLFYSLSSSLTWENIVLFLDVSLFAMANIVILGIISSIAAFLFQRIAPRYVELCGGPDVINAASVIITFPNSQSISTSIIFAVYEEDQISKPLGYTAMYLAVVQILLFSLGLLMMKGWKLETSTNSTSNLAADIEIELYENPATTKEIQHTENKTQIETVEEEEVGVSTTRVAGEHQTTQNNIYIQTILLVLKQVVSPPFIAIVLSFVVALIKCIRGLFVGEMVVAQNGMEIFNPPVLQPLVHVIEGFSNSCVPMAMVTLGSSICNEVPASSAGSPSAVLIFTLVIAAIRLVVLPLVTIPIIWGMYTYLHMFEDPTLRFVLMIQAGAPTATSVFVLSSVIGIAEAQTSRMVIMQYPLSVITLTFVVFISILLTSP